MTDEELLAIEAEQRRRLVELYRRTDERRFLEAAAKLRGRCFDRASLLDGPSTPSRRGPKKRIQDDGRFLQMAILLARGQVASVSEAAALVAREEPGHNLASTFDRLRHNYKRGAPSAATVAVVRGFTEPHPAQERIAEDLARARELQERFAAGSRVVVELIDRIKSMA
jgi:hypothetical protein